MTIATRLAALTSSTQTNTQNAVEYYIDNGGMSAIEGFLSEKARLGLRIGILHIDKYANPKSRTTGFATLSGELAAINTMPEQTIVKRNDIGWMYFNALQLNQTQFITEVNNLIANLVAEGLTVDSKIGYDMADITISW